jgi:hypothetical protein
VVRHCGQDHHGRGRLFRPLVCLEDRPTCCGCRETRHRGRRSCPGRRRRRFWRNPLLPFSLLAHRRNGAAGRLPIALALALAAADPCPLVCSPRPGPSCASSLLDPSVRR